ncbi:MAG: FAD-dependent oxidoreductase [Candidatus Scalindua sp.]
MLERRYKVVIPDLNYYLKLINCRDACPVNTHAGGYVEAIHKGNIKKGYKIARETNPLVSVCGRICAHPCEDACRRGNIDEPISIRALKRYVCEKYGVEGKNPPPVPEASKSRAKIAIIGSGPAGLSCAHELTMLGYRVTMFESESVPGGMLQTGIPEYRLPRRVVELEIDRILKMGVELRIPQKLGKNFNLDDLMDEDFKSVFIAAGAHKSIDIGLPGRDLDNVLSGIDFLLNVNLGYKVNMGRKVIVIGGGNVAIDIARTAARNLPVRIRQFTSSTQAGAHTGTQKLEDGSTSMDAARMAIRMGAKEVHVICLESREEMPAFQYDVEEAEREGVVLHPSKGPKRIIGENGKAVGLETLDVESVFDSNGRFNPTFTNGSENIMPSDTVILAIGQTPDVSWLEKYPEIALTPRGTIKVDNETLATTKPGIFAGGDAAFGPRIVVEAISDGVKAAHSINRHLGVKRTEHIKTRFVEISSKQYKMPTNYERIQRQSIPSLPISRRIGFTEVEIGYDDETARTESGRCLDCKVNTIFDSNKCILCGGCMDVCPENCLRLAGVNRLTGDKKCIDFFEKRSRSTAIVKDEEKCIRCGLCMKRCPTNAITMETLELVEKDNQVLY